MSTDEITFTKMDLRAAKVDIDHAIKRLDEFDEAFEHVIGVEYYVTAHFDATEQYWWFVYCYLKITTDLEWRPGVQRHLYFTVDERRPGNKDTSPQRVREVCEEMAARRGTSDIRFDPAAYVFEEAGTEGRLSWWKLVKSEDE